MIQRTDLFLHFLEKEVKREAAYETIKGPKLEFQIGRNTALSLFSKWTFQTHIVRSWSEW